VVFLWTSEFCYSYSLRLAEVGVNLFDELVELCAVPVKLKVGVWLAEVDVEQLSKDHAHWTLGRPRHRLQQQRNNRLLHRIRQTYLTSVHTTSLIYMYLLCIDLNNLTSRVD